MKTIGRIAALLLSLIWIGFFFTFFGAHMHGLSGAWEMLPIGESLLPFMLFALPALFVLDRFVLKPRPSGTQGRDSRLTTAAVLLILSVPFSVLCGGILLAMLAVTFGILALLEKGCSRPQTAKLIILLGLLMMLADIFWIGAIQKSLTERWKNRKAQPAGGAYVAPAAGAPSAHP
ncbi:MAG TPA: hypothetical protein PLE77_13540 [Kiritimatiellia bacterium]|nr:hypothetical protein [Kiritimatiellia bacterium]